MTASPAHPLVRSPAKKGAALVIVLFALLAMMALGHAALYVAGQEWAIAGSVADAAIARHTAESATALAASTWDTERYRLVPALEAVQAVSGEMPGGARYDVDVRRLGRELYLIESAASARGEGAKARVGRLVWALDPAARVGALPAALVSAGNVTVASGGKVMGKDVTRAPPGWSGPPCDSLATVSDSLYPSGAVAGLGLAPSSSVQVGAGGAVEGAPPLRYLPEAPTAGLGPLTAQQLTELPDRHVAGAVLPEPTASGRICDTDAAWNWGSPSDPMGPCGRYFPLVTGSGSVTLLGGEGQGVLVIDGDLEMRGGARYLGIIVVRGRLLVHDQARVSGFVMAGSANVEDGARVEASACAALRALSHSQVARRPFWISGGSWLSLY